MSVQVMGFTESLNTPHMYNVKHGNGVIIAAIGESSLK